MIMVADSQTRQFNPPDVTATTSTKWWPYYAIEGTPVTMSANVGEKYLITVVPQKGYKLTEWQKDGNNWTAVGTTGSYTTMQTLTPDKCTKAGANGMNVTDTRNDVSYTVGMFAERCWMYSNLRLEGGTHLTSNDSDLGEGMTFDVPNNTKANAEVVGSEDVWVDWYTKKEMIECKGGVSEAVAPFEPGNVIQQGKTCDDNTDAITEYYYNWYTAIANDAAGDPPTERGDASGSTAAREALDKQAEGSICPIGWRLIEEGAPGNGELIARSRVEIDTLITAQQADKDNNPGHLITSGDFYSGHQNYVGNVGYWWAASRWSDAIGLCLGFSESGASFGSNAKVDGRPVRCILRN